MVNLPPNEVRRIVSRVHLQTYESGSVIFRQDDPGDALYLIESGKVLIHAHTSAHGAEMGVATIGEGETFGEISMVTGQPRVATVEAEEDTTAWVIRKDDFDEIVAVSPRLLPDDPLEGFNG